jgi:LPS O-antigen subunit length determinant protein (WzzB/FepE family)
MAQNLTHPSHHYDEIDLREIFKILIESKKLILSSLLIFTIASIIYSLSLKPSFKTSAKLEIGYVPMINGDRELIESPSALISDLKVLIMKNPNGNFIQKVSKSSFENKIIILETTSSSAEQNESLLTEIIIYIDERHSNLAILKNNIKKDQVYLNLESVNSKIAFIKEKQLSEIEDRLTRLTNELPIIDLEISQLDEIIIEDTNNLFLLKGNDNMLKARASNSPTLEEVIFTYKSKINALNRKKSAYILETKILNNKLENVSLQSEDLFNLEQTQKTLKNELLMLTSQNTIQTSPIMELETVTIKPKTQLTILLGIFMGFIAGILLVFIRKFLKNFRET